MNKIFAFITLSSLLLTVSCGNESNGSEPAPPTPTGPKPGEKMEIKINPAVKDTHASDFGFESGDKIGIYIVNYADNTPGVLKTTGNHVDNMCFTYWGEWSSLIRIYWLDDKTHSDFYFYYPFANSIESIEALPFELKNDQSQEADYKACDFIIGKATDVAPTETAVTIGADHLMSRMVIYLEAGNGFTKESLTAANIQVKINGIRTQSLIDLANATVNVSGEPTSITPFKDNSAYKALIVPQKVEECNLISVTVDGREFNLKKGFTFESGKSHNFTVTLSKTSNGLNININPWDEDDTDNGGTAE